MENGCRCGERQGARVNHTGAIYCDFKREDGDASHTGGAGEGGT